MTEPETTKSVLESIHSLFVNKIFLSTIFSLFIAQALKMIIYLLNRKNRKKLNALEILLWRTGGMPSSHSAVVCALVTATGIEHRIYSTYFIFSLVFAMVTLRDALGVRRAAGLQARALNNLGKQVAKMTDQEYRSVKEIQGHTPMEVLIGCCLGILITVVFYLL
ncbi:MAG: divergent PAP2 family protein [Treponema sp.]|jgi:acid phosphatase family membrane protein YuiD|nr:divergent PAP2 family protein [Treponema sp.]